MAFDEALKALFVRIPPKALTWLSASIVAAFIIGSFLILDAIKHGYSFTIFNLTVAGQRPEQDRVNANCENLKNQIASFDAPINEMVSTQQQKLADLRAKHDEARELRTKQLVRASGSISCR